MSGKCESDFLEAFVGLHAFTGCDMHLLERVNQAFEYNAFEGGILNEMKGLTN